MQKLIIKMHNILSCVKGFSTGYSSASNDQMMIDYEGKRYVATFEELCNAEDEDMPKTMKKYWR